MMLVKHSFAWICLVVMLSACSDAPAPSASTAQITVAERLQDLPVVGIELQNVVDTYVLGGNRTDVQRDAMTAKLVGSIVSWRFKVYDIAKEDGRYRVMSELMESSAAGSFGKFAVVAFVTPREEQDIQILLKLQTGNEVEILGRVDGVSARTALILSPAELVH